MSAALLAYRALTSLLEPFAPAVLAARARAGKEDPAHLDERLGRGRAPRAPGPLVWLHGASVGESVSLLPLVEGLHSARPGVALLVTCGTTTAAAVIAARLPEDVARQYVPVDAPGPAARFIAHWRPDAAVFIESEVWPNLLLAARAAGARTALLSARLSPPSYARWRRAPAAARTLFAGFDRVLAQDDRAAAALRGLGARDDGRLNLKRAGAALTADLGALAAARVAAAGRPVLLAASTHAGEDEIVLDAFAALDVDARLVIAPRHPARGAAIEALARVRGLAVGVRSRGEPFGPTQVYLADTLGELGLWLRLCDVALIGGALLPGPGGHNPLEGARLQRPLLTGPYVDAWREVYAELDAGVTTVTDAASLARAWSAVLTAPEAGAAARGAIAHRLAAGAHDASARAVAAVVDLLELDAR